MIGMPCTGRCGVAKKRDIENLPRSMVPEVGHGPLREKAQKFFKWLSNPYMSQASSAD